MLTTTEIQQAKILIVDDLPANVQLLEKMLRNAGYQNLHATTDPSCVLELYRTELFDLILLDLQMPVMDGYQVMEALKEVEPASYLPILVITAQPAEKLRALKAGAKDFVSKPFDLVEVQTRIHNMLEVRLLYKKLDDYNKVLEKTVQERTRELRESEARFKSFTKLSSDWYWEQDAEGEYTSVSGPVFDMLGIDASRDLDQTRPGFSEHWDSEEYAMLHANIEARQPFLNFVYSRKTHDGKRQLLQVSGEPIFDDVGRFMGYRGIGMELNERRRPDREVMPLRLAISVVDQALLLIDPRDRSLVDANPAACRLFEFRPEEFADINLTQLGFGSEDSLIASVDDLIHSQREFSETRQVTSRSGEIIPSRILWRAIKLYDEWIVMAAITPTEALSVFDGLD